MVINILSVFILLCVGASYLWSSINADNIRCDMSANTPQIEFIDQENDVIYNLETSRKGLSNVKKRHKDKFSELFIAGDTLGLTLGEYKYTLNVTSGFEKADIWQDAYCPNIKNVKVNLVYDAEIYVAREHAGNKCAFDVIMGHELDHHEINIRNKRKYSKWLKKDLPAIVADISKKYEKPIPKKAVQPTNNQISLDIKEVLKTYTDTMNARMKSENAKIDTIEEYTRLNHLIRACYSKKRKRS